MKKQLIFVSALLGLVVNAQEIKQDSTKVNSLDEVVIVASRKPTKITEIPGTVWVVPQQKIQNLATSGVPVKEMLGQLIPSLGVGSQGRTNYSQNMRGRRILVMIDGVSLNSLRGVSRHLDAIDPFNIERIEVLSGASSIYGGNATGGIINITTKTPKKEELSGETKLGYRSGFMGKDDGDYSIAQSFGLKYDKAHARLGIAFQQNGGVFGADEKQVFTDVVQTDLQYNKSIDVLGTGGYKFNKNHSISVLGQYYNSHFNGDKALFFGPKFGAFKDPSLLEMKDGFYSDQNIGTQRYMGILSYRGHNILGGQDLHLQLSSRAEELGFYPLPTQLGADFYSTLSTEQNTYYKGIKLVLNKTLGKLDLTYGLDADFEDFEAFRHIYNIKKTNIAGGLNNETIGSVNRYPDVNSKSYAGYFQGTYKIIPELTFKGGLRYQFNDIYVSEFVGPNEKSMVLLGMIKSVDQIKEGTSTYDVFLANAGLLYKPNENHQIWATFSQGAELADPAKLYSKSKYKVDASKHANLVSSVNINDSDLQGIVTNQFELGYRTNINGLKAQIASFYGYSDKAISKGNDANGNIVISVDDSNVRDFGFEAEASYTNNGFYIGANTLFIKSQQESSEGEWVNRPLYVGSLSKIAGHLGCQIGNFSARFQNQQTFDLKDSKGEKIKGYNLTDASFGYKTPYGKFTLAVQNMWNTNYQTVWSRRAQYMYRIPQEASYYKGRGRTFNVGYSLEF